MIFDQKQQTVTKRNHCYVAKQFACLLGRKGDFLTNGDVKLGL
jgi:hypothetical protein